MSQDVSKSPERNVCFFSHFFLQDDGGLEMSQSMSLFVWYSMRKPSARHVV